LQLIFWGQKKRLLKRKKEHQLTWPSKAGKVFFKGKTATLSFASNKKNNSAQRKENLDLSLCQIWQPLISRNVSMKKVSSKVLMPGTCTEIQREKHLAVASFP